MGCWVGGKSLAWSGPESVQRDSSQQPIALVTPNPGLMTEYQYHTEPMAHQRRAFELSRDKPTYAFFMEPGTGKSKVGIDTAAYLYENGLVDAVLIVADNGVHENWSDVEIPRHCPPRVKARPVAYRSGKSLKKFFAALGEACRDFPFLCVSFDTLTTKVGNKFLTDFMKQHRVLMIIDESQRIKTPSAKRTRAAWAFGKLAAYRRILTGTSITRGYEDLYAQFRFLDWRILHCNTYTEFKNEFCIIRVWDGFSTIEGYQHLDVLKQRMRPRTFVQRLQDCMDLPERHPWSERPVAMTDEQRRMFKQLRDEYLTEASRGEVVSATLTVTRMLRLMQIEAGHVRLDDGKLIHLPTDRPKAVWEDVNLAPDKVIVWCAWEPDVDLLEQVLAEFGVCVFKGGSMTHAEAMASKQLWHDDPSKKVLISTLAKGARGYTWNEASTSLYYSFTHDYEQFEQSQARNYRKGQDKVTHRKWYPAPGGMNRKVWANLLNKDNMALVMKDPTVFTSWLREMDP